MLFTFVIDTRQMQQPPAECRQLLETLGVAIGEHQEHFLAGQFHSTLYDMRGRIVGSASTLREPD